MVKVCRVLENISAPEIYEGDLHTKKFSICPFGQQPFIKGLTPITWWDLHHLPHLKPRHPHHHHCLCHLVSSAHRDIGEELKARSSQSPSLSLNRCCCYRWHSVVFWEGENVFSQKKWNWNVKFTSIITVKLLEGWRCRGFFLRGRRGLDSCGGFTCLSLLKGFLSLL